MITTTVISTTTSLSTRKTSLLEQQSPHMTSLEVAEICGKRHADLMRAIRNMEPAWQKIRGCKFALSSRKVIQNNGGVRDQPCYELTKTETLYIATKFKDEERAKLVLRWEQLEMERLTQRQSMRLLTTKQEVLHESEEIVGEQLDEVNEESDGFGDCCRLQHDSARPELVSG